MSAPAKTGGVVAAVIFAVGALITAGVMGDTASRVSEGGDRNEGVLARLGQRFSALLHVGGSSAAAFVNPIWGLVWGLFAVGILYRRVGAKRGVVIRLGDFLGALDTRFRIAFAACVALPVLWKFTHFEFLGTLGSLAIPVMLGLTWFIARKYVSKTLDDVTKYDRFALDLKHVFGVDDKAFVDSGMAYFGENGVVIDPVASAISQKFELAATDAALAKTYPDLEIAPESTSKRIVIQTASQETLERRKALAASGGLFAGVSVPVPAVSAPVSSVPTTEGQTPLVISLEDL